MPKYFVGKWEAGKPYRIYSTAIHPSPPDFLRASIIWQGDDYWEGTEKMLKANADRVKLQQWIEWAKQ